MAVLAPAGVWFYPAHNNAWDSLRHTIYQVPITQVYVYSPATSHLISITCGFRSLIHFITNEEFRGPFY